MREIQYPAFNIYHQLSIIGITLGIKFLVSLLFPQ